jgi:hypothetical protein
MSTPGNIARVCFALVLVSTLARVEAAASRVAIIDIKNLSGSPNYDYLEASISDAIKERLKSKFAFSNMSRERWTAIAKDSFFLFEKEYATKSFALGIGLMGRQDLVVGGSFHIEQQKIITTVHLISPKEKRVIKEFTVSGPADARIFDSVNIIADRVAEEAKSVLPNKDEWEKNNSLADLRDDEVSRFNQLSGFAGIALAKLPSYYTGTLDKSTPLSPNELRSNLVFSADFQRFGLLGAVQAAGPVLWVSGSLVAGKDNYAVPYTAQQARATGIYGTAIVGAGYRWFLWKGLYATPLAGTFLSVGNLTLDYFDLDVKPKNPVTGKEEALQSFSFFTPGFALDGRIGWDLHRLISLEAGFGLRLHLYQNYAELLITAYGGVGYKF